MKLRFLSLILFFSALLLDADTATSAFAPAATPAATSAKDLLAAGRVDEAIDAVEQHISATLLKLLLETQP